VFNLKLREGQFIQSKDEFIFDVKGIIHPPNKVIAFIRYIPDEIGNRVKANKKFRKIYDLQERFRYLRSVHPEYVYFDKILGTEIIGVPDKDIIKVYDPIKKLQSIMNEGPTSKLQKSLVEMVSILERYGMNINCLGISGSILVGLDNPDSDIDLVCYGFDNCKNLRQVLLEIYQQNERIKQYNNKTIRSLYTFRGGNIDFETFVRIETRKILQGTFDNIDFYIRCVKDWKEINEKYGDKIYKKIGNAEIEAEIIDDSESFMSPVRYGVKLLKIISGPDVNIIEISSYRGRFCEIAKSGDIVRAWGTIEQVSEKEKIWYRLLLGNSPSDYLIQKKN